ncbi:MAG TPA: response regulator [Verrucomicrobiae bacterium]|nr:response regulator [Verrucomicrobiae bacterium]
MNRKAKILIVEDESPVAVTMSFLLTRAGCETEMASTRDEAIQMAQCSRFDLITLDVSMPNCSGFDLCAEIKQDPHLCHIPVVFVSGRCSLEDQQRGLDVGAVDYITKPFGANEFVPRLLSHIKSNLAHA